VTASTGSLPALGRSGVATLGLSCGIALACARRRLRALRGVPIVFQDLVERVSSAPCLLHAQTSFTRLEPRLVVGRATEPCKARAKAKRRAANQREKKPAYESRGRGVRGQQRRA
jgi:hypothetical protein